MLTMLEGPDVSEHQRVAVDDTYNRDFLILRGAFGTVKMDDLFLGNTAGVKRLWDAGRLRGGAVIYSVFLRDATPAEQFAYLWNLIGPTVPPWLTGILLDVEAWRGQAYAISGDHSPQLNKLYALHAHKMGSWKGCKGYANWGDMRQLWPHRDPRCEFIEANYGPAMPTRPGKVGQQYTDGARKWPMPPGMPDSTPPFGRCDHNAFFVDTPADFRRLWGRPTFAEMTRPAQPTTPRPKPSKPAYRTRPGGDRLVEATGHSGAFFTSEGLEVRRDHQHVAWIWKANP